METELLRTFLEVHRMRSFTRAAENLALTPSAVSARIRQLEGDVGRPLFKRSSQPVELTPAGERMLRHALGIVQALADGYVFVDWGTVFTSQHNRRFPHRPVATARSNSGRVAQTLIRACGGAAYLPRRLVESDLAVGRLYPVADGPVFEMQAYAAYAAHGAQRELIEQMLAYI